MWVELVDEADRLLEMIAYKNGTEILLYRFLFCSGIFEDWQQIRIHGWQQQYFDCVCM